MNIGEVLKANIDVILKHPEKLLHSLASVVHIRLCLSASEVVYPDGCCFHRLSHLECHPAINPRPHDWNQPGSVPRCLSSNLEHFEWINYGGTQYEKQLSTFIFKTAVFLKKASFTASSGDYKEKLQMLQELSFSRRVSSTCELVFKSLLSSTALVLESLHLKLDQQCSDVDVGFWITTAVKRGLRELIFEYCYTIEEPSRLPQSLYTCGTLVVLKLQNVSLVDVRFPVCFKLLKTLHLDGVIYLDDETPKKLLSCCPILECYGGGDGSELVMNTPSLKYFKTLDYAYKCMIEYLPEILVAHVEVTCGNTDDILRSLVSVKRLLLCLPVEPEFPSGSIFHQLEQLEFCTCETEWDLLMSLLQHSPKLRSLKLNETHGNVCGYRTLHWDEPSSVPETLLFVLETFEWKNYRGWNIERELASFVLKHARRLKVATFTPQASTLVRMELRTTLRDKYRMITELARFPRGSTECELVFG
ncbi:hypothetical protein Bca4012_017136 [Brassica carinata]